MTSPYLSKPLRSEEAARQEAHSRLSEELSQSLFRIAKDGARPHQIQAALERCEKLKTELATVEIAWCSVIGQGRLADCIRDVQYIESQLRAMS